MLIIHNSLGLLLSVSEIMRFVLEKKALKAVELTGQQLGQELLEKKQGFAL